MGNKDLPVYAFIIEGIYGDGCYILMLKNVDDALSGLVPIFICSKFSCQRLNVTRDMNIGTIGFMLMKRSGFTTDFDVDVETREYLFSLFHKYYEVNDMEIYNKMITIKRDILIKKLI